MKIGRANVYLCVWVMFALFYFTLPLASAATLRTLQPGEILSLQKKGPQTIHVRVKVRGEYTIQTLGDTDTFCTFSDRLSGPYKRDDDRGKAKNCRLDLHLLPGLYRLHIKKAKRPIQVTMEKYKKQGAVEEIAEGSSIQDTLRSRHFRSFQINIKRRRWVQFIAKGLTLHHCRLMNQKGWLYNPSFTRSFPPSFRRSTRRYRRHRRRRKSAFSCNRSGIFEPGKYTLRVYGAPSSAHTRPAFQKTAPLFLRYGARKLASLRWRTVRFRQPFPKQKFWFKLPHSTQAPHKKLTLVIQARLQQRKASYGWNLRLRQQTWMASGGRSKGYCWGTRYRKQCNIIVQVEAGKRYTLQVSGRNKQAVRFRYFTFYSQNTVKPDQRARQLAFIGSQAKFRFTIPKSGRYWLETWPPNESCMLQKRDLPSHKRIILTRGFSLRPHEVSSYTTLLTKKGRTLWFRVPKEGWVQLESVGRYNTYGYLKDALNHYIASDFSSGHKQNFRIKMHLKAGIYNIFTSIYSGHARAWVKLGISYKPDDPKYKKLQPKTKGCSFVRDLASGPYELHLSEPTRTLIQSFGLLTLPVAANNIIRVGHLQKTLQIPVKIQRRYTYIKVKRARQCGLWKNQKQVKKGKRYGRNCYLRGKIHPGKYTLRIPKAGFRGNTIQILTGRRISLKRQDGFQAVKEKKTPQTIPFTGQISQVGQLWTTLSQKESKWVKWNVKKAGIYRIESLGHLQVGCAVQTPNRELLKHVTNAQKSNCHLIQMFLPGSYRIQMRALGQTQGPVGIAIHKLSIVSQGMIRAGQRSFGYISGTLKQAIHATFQVDRTGLYRLQTHSLDAIMDCILTSGDGQILLFSSGCAFTKKLKQSKFPYHLWLLTHNPHTSARFRLLFAPSKQWASLFIKQQQWPTRPKSTEPIRLLLNQSNRTILSELGLDTYTFQVKQPMKVQFKLDIGMVARVFREKSVLMGEIKPSLQKREQTLFLQSGRYKLLVRHTKDKTGMAYDLRTKVIETQPNIRLWQPISSKLFIKVEGTQRIDIKTRGDRDVWCSLYDASGQQIARNDNRSKKRWDCHLSNLLAPGRYQLRIQSARAKGGTWVTIKQQPLLSSRHTKSNKKGWRKVPKGHVLGASIRLVRPKVMYFQTRTAKGQITCLLEQNKKYGNSPELSGSSCSQIRFLAKGLSRWRVRSTTNTSTLIRTTIRPIAWKSKDIFHSVPVSFPLKKTGIQQMILNIRQAGLYQILVPDRPVSIATCQLAAPGQAPHSINCFHSMYLSKGYWYLHFRTAQKIASIKIAAVPLRNGHTQSIQMPVNQVVNIPIQVKKTGVYAIQVNGEDDRNWGCSLGQKQQVSANTFATKRCRFLLQLKSGRHNLKLWRPTKANGKNQSTIAHVSLKKLLLPTNQRAKQWKTNQNEGKITLGQTVRWQLTNRKNIQAILTLRGSGSALLLGTNGQVLHHCTVHTGIKSCRWNAQLTKGLGQVWLYTNKRALQYHISLQDSSAQKKQLFLRLGQSKLFSNIQQSGRLVLWLRGEVRIIRKPAIFEVEGGEKKCILYEQGQAPIFHLGCRQLVRSTWKYHKVVIHYRQKPTRILFYQKNLRVGAIWGKIRPNSKQLPTAFAPAGQRRFLRQARNKMLRWYRIKLSKRSAITVRGSQDPMSCALFTKKRQLIHAYANLRGCKLTTVLDKGTYWVGIQHPQGKELRGFVQFESVDVRTIEDGRHGPYVQGPGMTRWFVFFVKKQAKKKTSTIGIGAVADREELNCQLRNANQELQSKGCQQYASLSPGMYYFAVSLPKSKQATSLTIVLRGLKLPKQLPPRAYLKKLMHRP